MINMIRSFFVRLSKILVIPWFWSKWFTSDQIFLHQIKNLKFPPSLLFSPVVWAVRAKRLFQKEWQKAFSEYAVNRYTLCGLAERHYGEKGRPFFINPNPTDLQCAEIYASLKGRTKPFFEKNELLMSKVFLNGDTFLDVGCNSGHNLKVLLSLFPDSKIQGFDVHPVALKIARIGTKETGRVNLETGSLVDFDYLASYEDNSFDHVILSHVIAFLIAESMKKTTLLHQKIISELIRISKKSILILDGLKMLSNGDRFFEIEQRDRGSINEFLPSYFESHQQEGELYCMFAESSVAFHFIKK
jgi:SAM-dependent methyltransferase